LRPSKFERAADEPRSDAMAGKRRRHLGVRNVITFPVMP
jgi:hypothetical protein